MQNKTKAKLYLKFYFYLFFLILVISVRANAKPVEKIHNSEGYWITDGYQFYIDMRCGIQHSLLPTKVCHGPFLVVDAVRESRTDLNVSSMLNFTSSTKYFHLSAGNIHFGDELIDEPYDPNRRVSVGNGLLPQKSESLYSLLISKPDTQFTLKTKIGEQGPVITKTFILADFKRYADKSINIMNHEWNKIETDKRMQVFISLSVFIAFLAVTLWAVFVLIRRGRKKLKTVKHNIETKRVARIVEDETIRQTVRNSLQKADNSLVEIRMPDIEDFKHVTVIDIPTKEGDRIGRNQLLVTLESDKSILEIPSPHAGVVREVKVHLGDMVSKGSLILTLDVEFQHVVPVLS